MSEGFKVATDDGSMFFLKRVRVAGAKEADALRRELSVYAKLQRSNVVNLLAFHTFERDDEYFALVTEFADGGTLHEYVTKRAGLKRDEVLAVGRTILAGLRELHTLGIVHRDLKPANVLRAARRWKLADFGISKDLERAVTQGRTFKEHGTPGFAPPEQWNWSEAHPSADIFAFGSMLAFLRTGQTFASPPDAVAALERAREPRLAKIVRQCTAHSPQDRPSLEVVEQELLRLA